jgi:hypothetical protein
MQSGVRWHLTIVVGDSEHDLKTVAERRNLLHGVPAERPSIVEVDPEDPGVSATPHGIGDHAVYRVGWSVQWELVVATLPAEPSVVDSPRVGRHGEHPVTEDVWRVARRSNQEFVRICHE